MSPNMTIFFPLFRSPGLVRDPGTSGRALSGQTTSRGAAEAEGTGADSPEGGPERGGGLARPGGGTCPAAIPARHRAASPQHARCDPGMWQDTTTGGAALLV